MIHSSDNVMADVISDCSTRVSLLTHDELTHTAWGLTRFGEVKQGKYSHFEHRKQSCPVSEGSN